MASSSNYRDLNRVGARRLACYRLKPCSFREIWPDQLKVISRRQDLPLRGRLLFLDDFVVDVFMFVSRRSTSAKLDALEKSTSHYKTQWLRAFDEA